MIENPWLITIKSGLSAHFKEEDGSSRPGVDWIIELTRSDEKHGVLVKALLADDATPETRENQEYQAQVAMQYLNDRLNQGWHPAEEMEHTIYISNPN